MKLHITFIEMWVRDDDCIFIWGRIVPLIYLESKWCTMHNNKLIMVMINSYVSKQIKQIQRLSWIWHQQQLRSSVYCTVRQLNNLMKIIKLFDLVWSETDIFSRGVIIIIWYSCYILMLMISCLYWITVKSSVTYGRYAVSLQSALYD